MRVNEVITQMGGERGRMNSDISEEEDDDEEERDATLSSNKVATKIARNISRGYTQKTKVDTAS